MDPRRLIKLGNSSFAVSLPKEWIDKAGLKKGDLVFLENLDGNLVVAREDKENKIEEKPAEIDISGKNEDTIIAEISSFYINNFNNLSVRGIGDIKRIKEIKKILENFMGFEIVEQNENKIVIKDTLGTEMLSIKEIIRRMDNSIRSMFEDLLSALNGKLINKKLLLEVVNADKDVNKLYFLIWKLVRSGMRNEKKAKALGTDFLGLSSIQWLSMNLESIGDEIKRIVRFLNEENSFDIYKETLIALLLSIKKNYEGAMTSYYKNDKDLALEIASLSDSQIIDRCNEMFKKYNAANVARIIERIKNIQGSIHYITRGVTY